MSRQKDLMGDGFLDGQTGVRSVEGSLVAEGSRIVFKPVAAPK